MRKFQVSRLLRVAAACAVLGAASTGWAATTWSLETNCASSIGTGTASCGTVAGTTITATAYSTANSATTAGSTFAAAAAESFGTSWGLGVTNGFETGVAPNHAIDNSAGTDLIALNFGTAVNLSAITLGYYSGDSDITVLAYTGTGAPAIAGKTLSSFTASNGWTSVNSYGSTTTAASGEIFTDKTVTLSDANTYSSWWLISAYNSGYGAGSGSIDTVADYVKVMAVAGSVKPTPSKVPEPSSLALMGAAFCAIVGARRRVKSKQA
ncbi:MAG: hypothetical protein JWQ88_1752 [Rhodoferax sp.]|nr:hypothetical protein [Rhodoferax sp.]